MTTARTVKSILFATLVMACGAKTNPSICDQASVTPNPVCNQACDPSPGASASCPSGYYCSPDGKCDAQCDATHACSSGFTCDTQNGVCVDDGTGSGSGGADANCPAINFVPMPTTPSISLVLDQSGSMFDNNISGGVTRYAAMRDALVGNNGVVASLEAKAYFGSELYTCSGANLALAQVPRALNNAAAIRASIDSKTSGENTPTPEGINAAVAAFAATPAPAGSPPVIVLATDGLPNICGDGNADTRTQSVAAAKAAFNAGIPVYVLAINQADQHFQDLANAGAGVMNGQPDATYYPVSSAAALAMAFQTIINGVVSCDLNLTSSIDAAAAMNGTVTVNGMTLTYGTDWTLVNGNIIRLTGAACTTLKNSATPMVSASFPCGSVIF